MAEEKGQAKGKETEDKKTDFFESKLFKIITVGLYLGGVGGLGCTLAMYYLFIWESKMPELPILKKSPI